MQHTFLKKTKPFILEMHFVFKSNQNNYGASLRLLFKGQRLGNS